VSPGLRLGAPSSGLELQQQEEEQQPTSASSIINADSTHELLQA
jgi:hypothetical protein